MWSGSSWTNDTGFRIAVVVDAAADSVAVAVAVVAAVDVVSVGSAAAVAVAVPGQLTCASAVQTRGLVPTSR